MLISGATAFAWTTGSRPKPYTRGPAAVLDGTATALLELQPAYQAAVRSGEALPKLRLLRQHLGVSNASLVLDQPRFWSLPLEKTLLPRLAYESSLGCHAERSSESRLARLLLAKDDQFVEALDGATAEGYAHFAKQYRKGGLDAAREGRADLLRELLRHGWSGGDERDARGASALHYAAAHGHEHCVALLLDEEDGLTVNDRAADGATPLHWAVAGATRRPNGFGTGGHLGTAAQLVSRGADTRATTHEGNSVLHWSAWAGGLPLLTWLCSLLRQGGTDPRDTAAALNAKGCSAAHWAASGGDLAVCRLLAEEHGLDFARANHEGNTPLTKAIEHGREDVVTWLLQSGRCEAAWRQIGEPSVSDAAGYAARLATRHSADATTARIAETLQAYLLAAYHAAHVAPRADVHTREPWPNMDLEARFELVKRLHDRGLIDHDEFKAKKGALLDQI